MRRRWKLCRTQTASVHPLAHNPLCGLPSTVLSAMRYVATFFAGAGPAGVTSPASYRARSCRTALAARFRSCLAPICNWACILFWNPAGTFTGSILATPASRQFSSGNCPKASAPGKSSGRARSACSQSRNWQITAIATMCSSSSHIHVPHSMTTSGPSATPFVVEAKWLICREVCLPEHAQLQLGLPRASERKQNPSAARFLPTPKSLYPNLCHATGKPALHRRKMISYWRSWLAAGSHRLNFSRWIRDKSIILRRKRPSHQPQE